MRVQCVRKRAGRRQCIHRRSPHGSRAHCTHSGREAAAQHAACVRLAPRHGHTNHKRIVPSSETLASTPPRKVTSEQTVLLWPRSVAAHRPCRHSRTEPSALPLACLDGTGSRRRQKRVPRAGIVLPQCILSWSPQGPRLALATGQRVVWQGGQGAHPLTVSCQCCGDATVGAPDSNSPIIQTDSLCWGDKRTGDELPRAWSWGYVSAAAAAVPWRAARGGQVILQTDEPGSRHPSRPGT